MVNLRIAMPLSWIYKKIVDARNRLYDRGVFDVHDLGARTISVGNITTGGTGKTPLVILVSQILAARGKRVCILTRGYGRKEPKKRVLVSDGKYLLSDAAHSGDEPFEMAKMLLGKAVVVVADARRVAAAAWARPEFGVTTFVLDDGFQHRRAKRDLDIVCIDALNPFGGGKMLPFGKLREPLSNLKRAGAIVITRADLAANIPDLKSQIAEFAPDCPIFTATSRMSSMTLLDNFLASDPNGEAAKAVDFQSLAHASGFAFCGLGNPESFFGQLRRDNYQLAGTQAFADHQVYGQKEIEKVNSAAKAAGAWYLLTTAKDAVKLGGLDPGLPCFVVNSELVLDDRERFAAML